MGSTYRRGPDPLEQGLDRLVSAGRQFVDGVSGARPGGRPPARGTGRPSGSLPRLDGLGRWVEDKLDWILEDGDDWREPWQDQRAAPRAAETPADADIPRPSRSVAPGLRRRRPLEAISRRAAAAPPPLADPAADWPDDASFTVPRWQRPPQEERPPLRPGEAIAQPRSSPAPGRPLPRSSRRRGA